MKAKNVGATVEEWRGHVNFVVLTECVADLVVKVEDVMESWEEHQIMNALTREREEVWIPIRYIYAKSIISFDNIIW